MTPDELETRTRADLIRTDQILVKLDVNRLAPEAREAFKEATRYKRLAEGELREKNFASAASYAEKALTFALALTQHQPDRYSQRFLCASHSATSVASAAR